ncbi:MAG: WYL domain-containing protein [Deltaproteobacteria bacterium]|jgi:predicted DNA-binding transcriptional regulator YafY|nr:WYL domain-containing protein [Deltaproteobacteria bacterium]
MPKYEEYGLFKSLMTLALWMQSATGGVTIAGVMERFAVSRRTAERMRNAVAEIFPSSFSEVRDGNNKSFKINSKFLNKLTLSSFTEEELGALKTASGCMRKNNLQHQAELVESATEKLKCLLELSYSQSVNLEDIMKSEGIALRPSPRLKADQKTMSLIREAVLSFHCINVTYKNIKGVIREMTLIPMGIIFGERNHYLVARFPQVENGTPLHFILDRISNIKILPETFEEDPDFNIEKHALKSFGAFQEEPFECEWLFAPEAAGEASRMIFHPSQNTVRNPDGSLTVKFVAGGSLEMAWHLYTWGDYVKVVKPEDFWDNLPDPSATFQSN